MSNSNSVLFVVDDELSARQSIAALAASLGIQCELFSSAEEFLRRFDPALTGCLLIDLVLGGMSGLDLQKRLFDMGSNLHVILISAFVDVRVAVQAMQNGAVTVLEKPYAARDLTQAIVGTFESNKKLCETQCSLRVLQRRLDALSHREWRVMELTLADKPNRVIATELGIGRRTVDRIRSTTLDKLDCVSVLALAQKIGAIRTFGDTGMLRCKPD